MLTTEDAMKALTIFLLHLALQHWSKGVCLYGGIHHYSVKITSGMLYSSTFLGSLSSPVVFWFGVNYNRLILYGT